MAILCHLLALAGLIVPFGHILGPLVVWLVKKDTLAVVEREGREALNFNLSFTIYAAVAGLTIFVLVGFVLLPAVILTWLILVVMASIKVANGESYRYPLTIGFLK